MKRSLLIHAMILIFLALILAVMTFAGMSKGDSPGGLFQKNDFIRLVWIGLGLYGLVSSIILFAVIAVCAVLKRPMRSVIVVLCHIVPVILAIAAGQTGVHDTLQNFFAEPSSVPADPLPDIQTMNAVPPSAPLRIQTYQQADSEITVDTQK